MYLGVSGTSLLFYAIGSNCTGMALNCTHLQGGFVRNCLVMNSVLRFCSGPTYIWLSRYLCPGFSRWVARTYAWFLFCSQFQSHGTRVTSLLLVSISLILKMNWIMLSPCVSISSVSLVVRGLMRAMGLTPMSTWNSSSSIRAIFELSRFVGFQSEVFHLKYAPMAIYVEQINVRIYRKTNRISPRKIKKFLDIIWKGAGDSRRDKIFLAKSADRCSNNNFCLWMIYFVM